MTRNRPTAGTKQQTSTNAARITPVPNATVPYWRSELHHLDEYRSTPYLPSTCDIAIIGAGISGVSLAYHLLQAYDEESKPSITILEARQVCSGATGRNEGHSKIRSTTMHSLKNERGFQAAEELWAFWKNLVYQTKAVVEKEKLDCEFELRRSFDVFLDQNEANGAERHFFESVNSGEKWTRDCDFVPAERTEQVTSIRGANAAISVPACSLWPYKFVTQLLDRIIDSVNLQTNTPVLKVSVDPTSGLQFLQTSRGLIKAKKVVFASNGYTGGLSSTYKDMIVPLRITASHLRPDQPVSPHLSNTYNICYSPTAVDYLNPRPDGGIVVGGAKQQYVQDQNAWYNNWNDAELLPNVNLYFDGLMQRHYRGWEHSGSKLHQLWTGIIGYTADEMPHVGEVPGAGGGRYVIAGFNGGGMAMCFSAALGLAKMVKDGVSFEESGLPGLFEPSMERLRLEIEPPKDRT